MDKNLEQKGLKKKCSLLPCEGFNIEELHCNIPKFVQSFPDNANVKDSKNFSYLFANKNTLGCFGFESPEELKGKTVFDLQKNIPDKVPKSWANKVHAKDESVLKIGENVFFKEECFIRDDGYIVDPYSMKIPLFDNSNNIKAILTLIFDSIGKENTKNLFKKYQLLYKKDIKLGNKKFLEHIGLNQIDHIPTTRELECLVSLSECRNLKDAAKELTLSSKTLETHLHNIKLKLNNYDLSNILKYFVSTKYRKF